MKTTTNLPALWKVEEELQAFLDTEEMVPEEARAEFAAALSAKNAEAVAKRDRVISFIRTVEAQIDFSKAEEHRIREHRNGLETKLEEFRDYVAGVVNKHGEQKEGQKTRTLRGSTGVLRAQTSAGRVVVTDDAALPWRFKRATVTFDDAEDWARFVRFHSDETGALFFYDGRGEARDWVAPGTWKATFEPSLSRIGEALDRGEEVPGADKTFGTIGLRLK